MEMAIRECWTMTPYLAVANTDVESDIFKGKLSHRAVQRRAPAQDGRDQASDP